jgi:hypothetical protein
MPATATPAAELTSHEFLFGDNLDLTVEWIVGEALRDGSQAGFAKAAHELHGIDRFLLSLGLSIPAMRISNTQRQMNELADSEELRTAWAAMKTESGVGA